jgi:hypothetical protein
MAMRRQRHIYHQATQNIDAIVAHYARRSSALCDVAWDTRGNQLVKVLRGRPLPAGCYRVVRFRGADRGQWSPYDSYGYLREACWQLPLRVPDMKPAQGGRS